MGTQDAKKDVRIIERTGKWIVDRLGRVREVIYKKSPSPLAKYKEFLKDKLNKLKKHYE